MPSLPNRVIVVRHGSRMPGVDAVAIRAVTEMQYVAEKIMPYCIGRVILLVSSANRARQSAGALMVRMGIPDMETQDCLWTEPGRPFNSTQIMACVEEAGDRCGTLVLVTHFEVMEWLPDELMRKRLEVRDFDSPPNPRAGEARVIDCTNKTFEVVPGLK